MDPPVGFAGAVVGYRHERVQFAAQVAQLAVHGRRLDRLSRLMFQGPLLQLLVLTEVQQRAFWTILKFLKELGR